MKEIKLTQGKIALVDDEDYDYLNQWNWYAKKYKTGKTHYVARSIKLNGKQKTVLMHRVIMNVSEKTTLIDHEDFNGLNNQKCNLRICTKSQNNRHTRSREGSTSKYLGVSLFTQTIKRGDKIFKYQAWVSRINKGNKKDVYLGRFKSETEAALAYNIAAIKYHGEFANLNQV